MGATDSVKMNSNITLNANGNGLFLTSGMIYPGSNILTLAATTTISGGSSSSFVAADSTMSGNTGQLSKTFPIGASAVAFTYSVGEYVGPTLTQYYAPVAITFTGNSTQRTIGLNVKKQTVPNENNNGPVADYVNRYWTFTDNQSGVGTYTYNPVALTYTTNGTTDVIGNTGNYRVNFWKGGTWTQLSSSVSTQTVTTTTAYTQTTGTLGGSNFTLRNNPTFIPG